MPHQHIFPSLASTLVVILLIRSGDVHVNPGPIKYHSMSHMTQPVISMASADEFPFCKKGSTFHQWKCHKQQVPILKSYSYSYGVYVSSGDMNTYQELFWAALCFVSTMDSFDALNGMTRQQFPQIFIIIVHNVFSLYDQQFNPFKPYVPDEGHHTFTFLAGYTPGNDVNCLSRTFKWQWYLSWHLALPPHVRPQAEERTGFLWCDSRRQAIGWAARWTGLPATVASYQMHLHNCTSLSLWQSQTANPVELMSHQKYRQVMAVVLDLTGLASLPIK